MASRWDIDPFYRREFCGRLQSPHEMLTILPTGHTTLVVGVISMPHSIRFDLTQGSEFLQLVRDRTSRKTLRRRGIDDSLEPLSEVWAGLNDEFLQGQILEGKEVGRLLTIIDRRVSNYLALRQNLWVPHLKRKRPLREKIAPWDTPRRREPRYVRDRGRSGRRQKGLVAPCRERSPSGRSRPGRRGRIFDRPG
jgi:hypothetical protein